MVSLLAKTNSPSLRTKIGKLAQKQEKLQHLYYARAKRARGTPLNKFLSRILFVSSMVPLLLGLLLTKVYPVWGIILIILGVALVVGSVYVARTNFGTTKNKISRNLDKEILLSSRELEADIHSLSKLVFDELSDTHKAKLRPTLRHVFVDFAEILKAIKGKGILLESIECPHCGAPLTLPKTGKSIQCSHCNRTVLALDLFDKLKNVLM